MTKLYIIPYPSALTGFWPIRYLKLIIYLQRSPNFYHHPFHPILLTTSFKLRSLYTIKENSQFKIYGSHTPLFHFYTFEIPKIATSKAGALQQVHLIGM